MTWLWVSMVIILLGAQVNAEAEHQTAEDSTTGVPRAIGTRGAVMADTIGAASGSDFSSPAPAVARGKGMEFAVAVTMSAAAIALIFYQLNRERRR